MDTGLKSEIEMLNERSSWESGGIMRQQFSGICKDMETGLMVLIYGLRRTGKTHLMHQILSKKEASFYFSFDKLVFQKGAVLEEVIRHALSIGADAIALDEIQKVPDWSGILKSYYDHFKPAPRFLLSGSSSLQLKKGKESLAGRIFEHEIPPLTYREYLVFRGVQPIFRTDRVEEYVLGGGFPEGAAKNLEPIRYAQTIVDKIVNEDIPQQYGVLHPEHIPDIVRLLAERTGQLVDYRDLASAIGISKDTVKRYIMLLEKSFLLDVVYASGKHGSSIAKSKKIYFAHPQLARAYAPLPLGFLVENAVYMQLKQLGKTGFWRSGRQEVDFVLEREGRAIPIEVKYQNSIAPSDLKNLGYCMGQKGQGIAITKNTEGTLKLGNGSVRLVPLHEFLYDPKCIL